MNLKINPSFKRLIPPLSKEELQGLTESILAHGCRNPIRVWKGEIADGNSRYIICKEHGIPFKIVQLRLASRKDVLIWIVNNQLGRRNLTNAAR